MSITAEARGKLRAIKKQLATNYKAADDFFHSLSDTTVRDLMLKRKTGQKRAFEKFRPLAKAGAVLEAARLHHHVCLVWSVLKPREAVAVESDDPGDMQNCVCVEYFVFGWMPPLLA